MFKSSIIILLLIGFTASNTRSFTKNELLGKIMPEKNADFIKIDSKYTSKPKAFLRKEAYYAFVNMHNAALKDGVHLNIVSAFRSFNKQKYIWEAKWNGRIMVDGQNAKNKFPNTKERALEILKYSSMPGSSRHHWGTDIDIYSVEDEDFNSGTGLKIYNWLKNNASKYGFCQIYNSERNKGFDDEKWHWSYLPLSKEMQNEFKNKIKYSDLSGFLGDKIVEELKIIEDYVFGINQECL